MGLRPAFCSGEKREGRDGVADTGVQGADTGVPNKHRRGQGRKAYATVMARLLVLEKMGHAGRVGWHRQDHDNRKIEGGEQRAGHGQKNWPAIEGAMVCFGRGRGSDEGNQSGRESKERLGSHPIGRSLPRENKRTRPTALAQ